jgi:hypothetical protein
MGPASGAVSGTHPAVPGRRPPASGGRKKSQVSLYSGIVAAVVISVLFLYRQQTRPGKVQLVVTPSDAEIAIDDVPVRGASPVTIERSPGAYHLIVKRDGYVRKDQNLEIQPGEVGRLEIALEASPDTGFELTSEPQGALVWFDGQPFTGRDPGGTQARTPFKAHPVTPGRHVLEIKDDPRFNDWRLEFLQDPGKTVKLHADLTPRQQARPGAVATRAVPGDPATPERAKKAPVPATAPASVATTTTKKAAVAVAPPPRAASSTPRPRPTTARAPSTVGRTRTQVRRTVATRERPARTETPSSDGEEWDKPTAKSSDCSITVGSKPWSEVWVDGKNTSKITPLVDFPVSCGKHKLTFKNSELKIELTKSVSVQAGAKFKQVFTLIDTDE